MPDKNHKNCIEMHKSVLESDKFNFRCKKEFIIPVDGRFDAVDLGCFRKSNNNCKTWITAIGIEAENKERKNFNSSAQIRNNKNDLVIFSTLFGKDNTKTYHITTSDVVDFNTENLNCETYVSTPNINKTPEPITPKKDPFTLKPFDLTKKNLTH